MRARVERDSVRDIPSRGVRWPLAQLGSLSRQPQRAFGFFIDLVGTSLARAEGDRRWTARRVQHSERSWASHDPTAGVVAAGWRLR